MSDLDIARALKDKAYFNSLTDDQKAKVRAANPVGEKSISDADLDSVSGGVAGAVAAETTTTTAGTCKCPVAAPATESLSVDASCACSCTPAS
jgi:mersacidin/lichenicidin family type 2 lantibiotic